MNNPMTPEQYSHIRARLAEAARKFGGIDYVSPAFGMVRDAMAEVDRLRAELEQRNKDLEPYEPLNPQQCPAGKHADWLVDSEHTHACPWCQVTELTAGREALTARLREGQRWQQGRTPPLVSQDYVAQDELRAMFSIPLVAPWDEPETDAPAP